MTTSPSRSKNKNARTTPTMRAAIAASRDSAAVLAKRYGVSLPTIYKWQRRTEFDDRPHTAHRLRTTLTPAQEVVAIELRRTLLLPLDDLLTVIRAFLCPDVSRPGLHRCLKRHGLSQLREMLPPEPASGQGEHEPGHLLLDVKPLAVLAEATPRCHLYVAVDRATRWVFARVRQGRNTSSARAFVQALGRTSPMHIQHVRIGNGDAFDCLLPGTGTPAPDCSPLLDRICASLGSPAGSAPQPANYGGAVERFSGDAEDVLCTDRFVPGFDLCQMVEHYARVYNHGLPQAALQSRTPIQALKDWYRREPALFRKRPYVLRVPTPAQPA